MPVLITYWYRRIGSNEPARFEYATAESEIAWIKSVYEYRDKEIYRLVNSIPVTDVDAEFVEDNLV